MPVAFSCAKCGYSAKVKDELAGRKIKCPKCKTVGVPGAAADQPEPEPDFLSGLAKVNLGKYQDVEPDEDEEEEEDEAPKLSAKELKAKKLEEEEQAKIPAFQRKPKRKPPEIPPAAKAGAILAVLVALALIGAEVFFALQAQ